MSINSTLTKLRKNELILDIAKMSVTQLIEKRAELRHIRLNAPNELQLDKIALSEVTMEISRELTKRADESDKESGIDPDAESASIIAASKAARKNDINNRAKRKLLLAQQAYDSMTPQQKATHLVVNELPNPHAQTPEDYGAVE